MAEYLAIKDWEEYQSLRGGGEWIKDYTQQDDKPVLGKLSMFQRGVYQEMRRVRGRTGHNILYDMDYILSAMYATREDRPRIPRAIRELIVCGLLIVTNQSVSVAKVGESKKENESKREKEQTPSARVASREPVVEQVKPAKTKPTVVFDMAYDCYPRHIGKRAAEKAWGAAVNREAAKCVRTHAEHEDFLYQRVMTYGAACKRFNKPREFIPHMATWLNQDRFLDDPSEWEVTRQEQRNGTGQVSKADSRERRIIESAVRAAAAGAGTGTSANPLALPRDGGT